MSKKFRRFKKFLIKIGCRGKFTFGDYKKSIHVNQKMDKKKRKDFLKAKSMLSQGRKSVLVGNALYYWGKDKKTIAAITPDYDMTRKVFEIIKKEKEEKNE